jgi:hypothetical protein
MFFLVLRNKGMWKYCFLARVIDDCELLSMDLLQDSEVVPKTDLETLWNEFAISEMVG